MHLRVAAVTSHSYSGDVTAPSHPPAAGPARHARSAATKVKATQPACLLRTRALLGDATGSDGSKVTGKCATT